MIDKKPKLQLKKRTIANLSNIEMRHVYGGGGDDEGDPSMKACDQNDTKDDSTDSKEIAEKIGKIVLTVIQTHIMC